MRAHRLAGSPNVDAVSAVIVDHLWATGHALDPKGQRSLKDRVARALRAQVFTVQTATLLADAFSFSAEDRDDLLNLIINSPNHFDSSPSASADFRTIVLHELHWVGRHRAPSRHRTVQTVCALRDGLEEYVYTFDTPEVVVRSVHGANASPVEPSQARAGFWQCRLRFGRPMSRDEIRIFEYETIFRYRDPPAPEMRRGVGPSLDALSMRVQFDPTNLPRQVWWSRWDSAEAPPVDVRELDLDAGATSGVMSKGEDSGLLGIRWQW